MHPPSASVAPPLVPGGRPALGRDATLAGALAGGGYGLLQTWAFLSGDPDLVRGSWLPLLAAGVVALHAALGAAAFLPVAIVLGRLLPGAFAGAGRLPRFCAAACALTAAGERAAALLAEGEGASALSVAIDALAVAAAFGVPVWILASRLSRTPPSGRVLSRVLPLAVAAAAILFGARGLVTLSRGWVPPASRLAALAAGAAIVWAIAGLLGKRFFREPYRVASAGWFFASVLLASAAGGAAIAVASGTGESSAAARDDGAPSRGLPNVLLVTVDTLRADAVGFSEKPIARTPTLDALAARGDVFENAFAPSAWTFPSLASLFTSRYPSECGAGRTGEEDGPILMDYWRRGGLDTTLPTLATSLRDLGYATGAVVTNVWLGRRFGFHRGFDRYEDATRGRAWHAFRPLRLYRVARRIRPGLDREGTHAARTTSLALATLERLGGRPFFLWVHYFDPHLPYDAPGASARTTLEIEDLRSGRFVPERARPGVVASYVAEVEYVDREIGRLLDALEARGLRERTIVALTSDHGEEFWEHGGFEHGHTFHAEVTRVPLVVVRPGAEPSRVGRPVSLLDLFPSLLGLLGEAAPPDARGRPLFDAEAGSPPLLAEGLLYGAERRWARTRERLVVLDPRTGAIDRFDLEGDPEERARAAPGDPASAAIEAELRAWSEAMAEKARAWRERAPVQAGDARAEDWLQQVGYIR